MTEIQALFDRQARWQRDLVALSWPEKIRMVEAIRESVLRLRASRPAAQGATSTEATGPGRDPA
jgi:hypothetical protein